MAFRLRNLLRADGGNVGIIFGLAALPLILGAGAAIDYSGATDLSSSLQVGTDATALTLCQAPANTPVADLRTRALASTQSYVKNGTVTVTDLTVTDSPRSVTLKTASTYPTAFMKIVNQPTVPVSASAACAASETYFEIALVLDTTGSMSSTGGTQTKMEAAKSAGKSFVDYMFTTGALPGHVKMSLVPFAATVAIPSSLRTSSWVDTSAVNPLHWKYITGASAEGFTSRVSIFNKLKTANINWDWDGCVESPIYPYNVKDDPVTTSTPKGMIMPFLAPDEYGNSYSCGKNSDSYCSNPPNYNSYLDDGTSSSGGCQNDAASSTRSTQACKYKNPTNIRLDAPGPNQACTSRPLSQLGTTQATLKNEITALQPLGGTNIHEGFMWGWRTISPTSVFSNQTNPPAAYGAPNTQKVIVLMTDGENQWLANSAVTGKSLYSAYGYFRYPDGTDATASNSRLKTGRTNLSSTNDGRAAIDELLLDACTNAKAKNVVVYTVGFSTSGDPIDAQGLKVLSDCATSADYAFVANDSSGIIAVFDKIAKGIGQLRLTR